MKKRVLSLLLALCMVVSMLATPAMAVEQEQEQVVQTVTEEAGTEQKASQEEETPAEPVATVSSENDLWQWENCEGGVLLTGYLGTAADLYVPGKVEKDGTEYTVVGLGDEIFADNDGLNSVTLGVGVSKIGAKAFYDCDNLVCIVTNDQLTTIGARAFDGCNNFNSIILYDTVTTIGENAFANCPKVTIWCNEGSAGHDYVVTNGVAYEILNPDAEPEIIEQGGVSYYVMNGEAYVTAFDFARTEYIIPAFVNGCPVVELRATLNNHSTVTSVVLPESLSKIPDDMFYLCKSLTRVNVPERVTIIGNRAFAGCHKLPELILPNGVNTIGERAFSACVVLTEINIPSGVTKISEEMLSSCRMLTSVVIPKGVTEIGDEAFSFCKALRYISIPDSVTTIGMNAFEYCDELSEVCLPKGLKKIGQCAFMECEKLTSIQIPDSVTTLGDRVFAGCDSLNNAVLGTGCEVVPGIFIGCTKLVDVVVPNGVKKLHETFKDCKRLQSVELPDTLITIGTSAFAGCAALESIAIPENVTEIGYSAFASCTALTEFVLPDSVTTIGSKVLDAVVGVRVVAIPSGVTAMQADSFASNVVLKVEEQSYACAFAEENNLLYFVGGGADQPVFIEADNFEYYIAGGEAAAISYNGTMAQVTVPERVNGYPITALCATFAGNTSLTAVTLPKQLKVIGSKTFYNCVNLSSVTIQSSLVDVGPYAFYACASLGTVDIPDSVTRIGKYAFAQCTQLSEVVLPSAVTEIGDSAFYKCPQIHKLIFPAEVVSVLASSFDGVWVVHNGSYAHTQAESNGELYYVWDGTSEIGVYTVGGVTYIVEGGKATAVSFDKTMTQVVIPEYVGGAPVTEIRKNAFYFADSITSVELPDTLKVIGESAFSYCKNLSQVRIPNGVLKIERMAFERTGLTDVEIPDSVTEMGVSVFFECKSLERAVIGTGLRHLQAAFQYCSSLTDVVLPEGLTTIGQYSFYRCGALKQIDLPESVTYIDWFAFESSGLESICIPESVSYIGNEAFANCVKLEKVVLPAGLTTVCNGTFSGCANLNSVILPDHLQEICVFAFEGCAKLQKVLIPSSVKKFSSEVFGANTVWMVYEGSYAHSWAEENEYLYFVLQPTENPGISYGTGLSGTVRYTDGTPAVGVSVDILYDDGTVKETVTADATGAYAFTYAEVGRYTIRATDTTGNTASEQVAVRRMNAFDVYLSGDTNLTLKQGWMVSGTVSDAATVTLMDEGGNTIAQVTGAERAFAFSDVPNGTYILKADGAMGSVTQEITVFNANLTGITLTLPEVGQTVTLHGYVEVELRDGSCQRRNWVSVTVYNKAGIVVGTCKSDNDGAYTFGGLPLGEYSILAQTNEMRPDKKTQKDRSVTLTGYAYVNADLPGEHAVETIVLYEENDYRATISGKVTANGETQDCEVILRDAFRNEIVREPVSTKKNGKFSFSEIPDGLYFITATTKSDGMGKAVILVKKGVGYGDLTIEVAKDSWIFAREETVYERIPYCSNRAEAQSHKAAIAEEKRWYDSLSEKEKQQLSQAYVERLEKLCSWIAQVEYTATEGVIMSQGGLVVSGDELEAGKSVQFNLTVEKTEAWQANENGVQSQKDHLYHQVSDAAGDREIKQYYEISMTRTVDGEEQVITSVTKDTDTTGKFRITLPIPEEYQGHKHYSVIHVHNGVPVTLTDLDDDPATITIEVDGFSTFVLTATDVELIGEVEEEEPVLHKVTVGAVSNGVISVDKLEGEVGTQVTVTVTPAGGYKLKHICVDGVAIVGNTFTITGDHVVTAEFEKLVQMALHGYFTLEVVNTIILNGESVDICRWKWTPAEA